MNNKTTKKEFLLLMLVIFIHSSIFSKEKRIMKPIFNHDIISSLSYEAGIGMTASFVGGKFIREFKDKYDNETSNLSVKTKVSPLIFGSLGGYVIYQPFKDSFFSKFSAVLGLEYYKRGFIQKYELDYNFSPKDIKDKTNYSEKYALNMLGIPISIRYGRKAYVEFGFVVNKLISANKIVRIKHQQSGADAIDKGYSVKDKEIQSLDNAGIKSNSVNLRIGGGLSLNSKLSLKTDFMLMNHSFLNQSNFHNYLCRLQLNIKINPKSFTK